MSTLERAIVIAAEAHAGQIDKGGAAYILHPLRVMMRLHTNEERIVGVLHDVVEDCDGWTIERLRAEGFTCGVINALQAVTKREGESYDTFVLRASLDPIGRAVKIADLQDNSDLSRIAQPTEVDIARAEKYRSALATIGGCHSLKQRGQKSDYTIS